MDQVAWILGAKMTLDDYVTAVDAAMPQCMAAGVKLLTPFLLGGTDTEHVESLLTAMSPTSGARVLDAGSGTGELARLMLRERPDLQFTLLNPSAVQLYMGPPETLKLLGAFESIPVQDASFDVVMFSQSIEHAEDMVAVLTEAARVLAPGGQVFIFGLRHVEGPQDHMTRLVWSTPRTAEQMREAAGAAGLLQLDAYEPLNARPMIAPGILGADEHRHIFGGVVPFVWRFESARLALLSAAT